MRLIGNGIKGKLWVGMMFLICIILLTAWSFQIIFLKSFYIKEREETLLKEGKKIVSVLADNNNLELTGLIKDELFSLSDLIHGSIAIIDNNKNLVDYIFLKNFEIKQPPRLENSMHSRLNYWLNEDPKLNDYLNSKDIFVLKSDRFSRASTIVGIPITNNDTILGTLILESPLAPIEESIVILKKQLTIISILSLILGTIMALLLSRHLTKPILDISHAAEKIAKGDFNTRVNITSNDEIGTLGKIINNLPQELRKLENFRKDFIANTTHELKTPISLIQAYGELIRDLEGEDKETRDQHLEVIIDESKRLNRIVEDILYMSQIEPENIKLNSHDFSLIELLQEVLEKLNFLAKKREIKIIVNYEVPEIMVLGDREKLYQVLFNILNNAIIHSEEKNKIVVNIFENKRIEIMDYGPGISAKDLPYIWDRFYKADKSRTRNNSSTGLGLAIVKNILDAHGFPYGVESTVNSGTTFWLRMGV